MGEICGVGRVLLGDCLGLGWDQLALLPPESNADADADDTLGTKKLLAAAGVTDGRRLWAFGRCVAVRVHGVGAGCWLPVGGGLNRSTYLSSSHTHARTL